MSYGLGDEGCEGERFDPDDMLWVRGVDYLAGWRSATVAGGELAEALESAGLEANGVKWQAGVGPDGVGRVRLVLSADAAREVVELVRLASGEWGKAG